jgi:hypothetical protein
MAQRPCFVALRMNVRLFARPASLSFIFAFVLALGFAAATRHVWEDYYTTFRSSKNLAEGYGLVFNQGDRLHTFTSPLGVLLPSLAYLLTGNQSDAGAIWIFRLLASGAFAGAAALLVTLLAKQNFGRGVALLGALALVTDTKSLDFTINGMETPFMLLFLAYAIWAHLHGSERRWLHLGLAWGGLQWTRPDSFIYVSLLAAGFWIFNDAALTRSTRQQLIRCYVLGAVVAAVLYLPWLVWAKAYYGTPIPHTIAAKGSLGHPHSLASFLLVALRLPYLAWTDYATLDLTFLPSYAVLGGWPVCLAIVSRILATLCAVLWIFPRVNLTARVASFAFFGAHIYLTYFPYFPFPWYLPSTALLAVIALAGLFGQLLQISTSRLNRVILGSIAIGLIALGMWQTWEVRRQIAAQQRIVENGTRQKIGEWLKAHSNPGDAVFLEPLGYIGYFSNLKTYDYPGMSSREIVASRKTFGEEWGRLIYDLAPRWVVLRPFEVDRITRVNPVLLHDNYQPVQQFDSLAQVRELDIRGRPYLEHDARFTVFELKRPFEFPLEVLEENVPFPTTTQMVEGFNMTLYHAPSRVVVRVPPLAKRLSGHYCIMRAAIEGDSKTDGATFTIRLKIGSRVIPLLDRTLDPAKNTADRPVQSYSFDLPRERPEEATLILQIATGPTDRKDWTCWDPPDFR